MLDDMLDDSPSQDRSIFPRSLGDALFHHAKDLCNARSVGLAKRLMARDEVLQLADAGQLGQIRGERNGHW